MKILIGMPSKDSWGGPISCEPPFVKALQNLDLDVTEEIYVYGDKEKPTPIFERIKRVWKTAFRFRKMLKTNNFDIIHLNTAFDLKTILRDSFSLFVMKPQKAKVFFKLHGSEANKFTNTNFLLRILINYLIKKVDAFGVLSKDELANFEKLEVNKEKLYVVKNAVTIQKEFPNNFERNAEKDTLELLFISRFIPTKGLLETIEACKILDDKKVNFKLYCLGDGEIRQVAEEKVKNYKLEKKIIFTGYISEQEVTEHLFNRDIFVFPTRHAEGFPMVLFKAIALGMPIVTTEIRSSKDYLKEYENCLFSMQDPKDIAEKIIELTENKDLRKSMSENNLKFAEKLLPENVVLDYLEIYKKMLSS